MEESTARRLRHLAGALALFVAAVHLLHPSQGGVALLVYANVGYLGDPRPLLFTLAAFALVSGVLLGYNGFAGRGLYLGGVAVTGALLGGFLAWHTVLDHGAFWPHLEANVHGGNPLVVAAEHLARDPLLLASKPAELALLGALVVLLGAEDAARR
jgi:hypothetical protein